MVEIGTSISFASHGTIAPQQVLVNPIKVNEIVTFAKPTFDKSFGALTFPTLTSKWRTLG
jgi:hypothetical protein